MFRIAAAAAITLLCSSAFAQVTVKEPWVRATVPQQKATGAFMQLVATQPARLVDARSPVAASVEIHEMTTANNMMKMRQIPGIDLPAGKRVELRPGSYHLMLFGLKQPLNKGETVPMQLVFVDAAKKQFTVEVQVAVQELGHAHHH